MAENHDTSASLSKEDKEKVKAWIDEKADSTVGIVCTVCQNRQWSIGDDLVAPPIFKEGGMRLGSSVAYPNVMLFCTNCSHTIFINAVHIGIVKSAEEITKSATEEETEEVPESDSGEAANG